MQKRRRWHLLRQGFLAGCLIATVLLFSWFNNLFATQRLQLTDVYYVPTRMSDSIVIVALDDASFSAYGRSPSQWSRTVYVDLLNTLAQTEARVVAFDVLFSEETSDDDAFAQAIQAVRQSDARLRIVLAAAGVPPTTRATNLEVFPHAIHFEHTIMPTEALRGVADYIGYVNTFSDVDGTVRRQPSVIQHDQRAALSWSLAVYLAYLRVPETLLTQVVTSDDAYYYLAQTRTLHIDTQGFWLQNFFGAPYSVHKQTFPVVSLVDTVSGKIEPDFFADKVVLVGLINSAGITDQYTVPSSDRGQLMTGVEIQANAIETLIQNRPVYQQSAQVQAALIVFLSIVSSVIYMQLRWYFKLVSWGAVLGLGVVGAFLLFEFRGEMVNLFDSGLALTLPVVITTGIDITNERNRRHQSEFMLQSVVQVSQQRLVLRKVLPHLATDIQRIVPAAEIIIWRCDQSADNPQEIYRWPEQAASRPPEMEKSVCEVVKSGKLVVEGDLVILPISWQKRLIAVYAVKLLHKGWGFGRSLALLEQLAEQLAPSLENAFLYTEIERQSAIRDAILTGSPAGILVLDQDLNVSRINHLFETTFAVKTDQLLNQPLQTFWDSIGLPEKNSEEIRESLQMGKPFRCEVTLQNRTFNLDVAPQKQFHLWVVILTEITHLIQLTQLKTYMIRMLSHDLGNPLARILGYAQLLANDLEGCSETHQEYLTYVLQSGEEMDRIIADVLNLEELRSAEFTLTEVDLTGLVTDMAARYKPSLLLKQQTLTSNVPDSPLSVKGNRRQLAQALMNLLSNATKYTPDGGHIQVELSVVEGTRARITVADSGYGIPEAAHAKIFTEFYRVKSNTTRDIDGTGLGLSLVKVVVDNHGGRVWVESEEGVGSTFFIELSLLQVRQD